MKLHLSFSRLHTESEQQTREISTLKNAQSLLNLSAQEYVTHSNSTLIWHRLTQEKHNLQVENKRLTDENKLLITENTKLYLCVFDYN